MFPLGGAILSAVGIYLIVKVQEVGASKSEAVVLPAFILAVGLLIFFLGFLGCTGAIAENVCLLKTFAVIMSILVLLEAVAAFLLFAFRGKCKEFVENALKKIIDRIVSDTAEPNDVAAMDFMQQKFQCCGAKSPADWGDKMPSSCCKNQASPCPNNSYTVGCGDAFYLVIKDSWLYLGIVILIIAILEVGAIASACILQSKITTYESV
ncbi:unnamed protein product [Dibothriocephalus latus]|uniref:Tetraspanin n=1 Tax=Dibothriocephalus latus TaxID=60516 RepID=A0A3P7LZ78_DIBLA|nr:unnamed protein product [Dibothriocephalus latus]